MRKAIGSGMCVLWLASTAMAHAQSTPTAQLPLKQRLAAAEAEKNRDAYRELYMQCVDQGGCRSGPEKGKTDKERSDNCAGMDNQFVWDHLVVQKGTPQQMAWAIRRLESEMKTIPQWFEIIDTYACLLYNAGKVPAAIEAQKGAIASVEKRIAEDTGSNTIDNGDNRQFYEHSNKMQNGTLTFP